MQHNPTRNTVEGTLVEVSIIIDGEQAPLYPWMPHQRCYVAGVPGRPYTIRVRNLLGQRIEVLPSVDGRSTLRDETADVSQPGFVLGIHQTYDFDGWQSSDRQHQDRFTFTDPSKAIAAQAGEPGSIGVIGVAAYREQPWSHRTMDVSYSNMLRGGQPKSATFDMAPVAMAGPPMEPALGTGKGESVYKPTSTTSFTRQGAPDLIVIGYNTVEKLREAGIVVPDLPQPFPGIGKGYDRYASV